MQDIMRQAIKAWLSKVMRDNGWTAQDWAKKAGTSPTNITRFMDPRYQITMSTDTLGKLVAAAGTAPDLFGPALHQGRASLTRTLPAGRTGAAATRRQTAAAL